jgi:hypothetical protein
VAGADHSLGESAAESGRAAGDKPSGHVRQYASATCARFPAVTADFRAQITAAVPDIVD